MTLKEVDEILEELNYYENFRINFLNKIFNKIDYGKRLGIKQFSSFFNANDEYSYSNQLEEGKFIEWNATLTCRDSTEEELLLTCLEIFDWGNVLSGNVKTALELYKTKKLKSYINWVEPLLSSKSTICKKQFDSSSHDIIWSSGWTKVYSFINNDILIYDSRVSAFLNHTLIQNRSQSDLFSNFAKNLYNFNGARGRKRQVEKTFGFKNQHPNGINGFNANLISSWIVQLLNSKLNLNRTIRTYERAFFMLGFDLKQIEHQGGII